MKDFSIRTIDGRGRIQRRGNEGCVMTKRARNIGIHHLNEVFTSRKTLQNLNQEDEMLLLSTAGTVYILSINTNEKKQNGNVPNLLISWENLPMMITANVSFVRRVSFSLTSPGTTQRSQEGTPSQAHSHL